MSDQDRIAKRAHELYLQRGSLPGHELDDWLQAEAEVAAQAAEPAEPVAAEPARQRPRTPHLTVFRRVTTLL